MVRQWQKMFYGKRYSSTTLDRPTDYKHLAKAFGAKHLRIDSAEYVEPVVKKALASKTPIIVNCVIGSDDVVLPMIPAGQSADKIILEVKE
jgi:acetolactate synthase-1/2/3 large subunit